MAAGAIPLVVRRRYVVALLAVFAILSVLVATGWTALDQMDINVEAAARDLVLENPPLLAAALLVTHAGDALTANLIIGVGAVILLLARRPDAALVLVLARVGAGVSVTVVKWMLERARPVWDTPLAVASGYSFPSGHSANAAAVYGTLALLAWAFLPHPARVARVVAVAAAALLTVSVASSRVLIGVHYTSDVLAGVMLGLTWMLAALLIVTRVMRRHRVGEPSVMAEDEANATRPDLKTTGEPRS
jgi:membrane-associated phospholipid phosphatase